MKSPNRNKQRAFPVRNRHACHPIMRKGGVHEKSKGAKRAAVKRSTQQRVAEWRSRSSFVHFKNEWMINAMPNIFDSVF